MRAEDVMNVDDPCCSDWDEDDEQAAKCYACDTGTCEGCEWGESDPELCEECNYDPELCEDCPKENR
jgi:hypothetical protein